jgi:hypothetical protein
MRIEKRSRKVREVSKVAQKEKAHRVVGFGGSGMGRMVPAVSVKPGSVGILRLRSE